MKAWKFLPEKWVPWSLTGYCGRYTLTGKHCLFLCHWEDISFATGEGLSPFGKRSNKNVLITHTKRQLNAAQQQVFEGSRERRCEASWYKIIFPGLWSWQVEISPSVLVHHFSHLTCTMVGEGMQKPKTGICLEAENYKSAIFGFP